MRLEREREEAVAEPIASLGILEVSVAEEARDSLTLPGLVQSLQSLELSFGEQSEIPETIEGRDAADAEMLGELDDIVELQRLTARARATFDLVAAAPVEDLSVGAAR
ncbi:MAG: hypothetical protein JNK60_12365, partial [Acidobacteria bacterium]|nr:hypothetical protein [Acidobacteriota bacterium]